MNKGKPDYKFRSWTLCVHDLNGKGFYSKNMIRTKEDHDKNMYP
jgi:hypothetical protein